MVVEGVYLGGVLYDSMMAVHMNRYKEKARKNAIFEKFKLVGFDPFIYTSGIWLALSAER